MRCRHVTPASPSHFSSFGRHVANVIKRGFVTLSEDGGRRLLPAPLGLALIHACATRRNRSRLRRSTRVASLHRAVCRYRYALIDEGLVLPCVRAAASLEQTGAAAGVAAVHLTAGMPLHVSRHAGGVLRAGCRYRRIDRGVVCARGAGRGELRGCGGLDPLPLQRSLPALCAPRAPAAHAAGARPVT